MKVNRIVRRAPSVHTKGPFLELAEGDPATVARLVLSFENTIKASFRTNPVRGTVTAGMVRERFQILEKWFRVLRGEKKWGLTRILDTLPEALQAELNDQTWQPDARRCWIPSDGR